MIQSTTSGAPATVSAQRAMFGDAQLAWAMLNQVRYLALTRVFGIPRDQVNLLTLILGVSVANATYEVARRFIRHPWPLSGSDTAIASFLVRESGLTLAGPHARAVHRSGMLIALAAISSVTVPSVRRALRDAEVVERRIVEARRGIYTAEERALATAAREAGP